jgi:hypothetical protein
MTRKSPVFVDRAFLNRVIYADVIDASNKEEKHGHTDSTGRNWAGVETVWAGSWGGYCAWIT